MLKRFNLVLTLIFICGLTSVAHSETCPFSVRIYEKLQVTSELDRKTKNCTVTISPLTGDTGEYQIYSFQKNVYTFLVSRGFERTEEAQTFSLDEPLTKTPTMLQFLQGKHLLYIRWDKKWVQFSTMTGEMTRSNFITNVSSL